MQYSCIDLRAMLGLETEEVAGPGGGGIPVFYESRILTQRACYSAKGRWLKCSSPGTGSRACCTLLETMVHSCNPSTQETEAGGSRV
jgi:hypothetical protein